MPSKASAPRRGRRVARRLTAWAATVLLCAAWLQPALIALPLWPNSALAAAADSERELQPRLLDQAAAALSPWTPISKPDAVDAGPDAWRPPLALPLGSGCVAAAPGEAETEPPLAQPERRRAATGPPAPHV